MPGKLRVSWRGWGLRTIMCLLSWPWQEEEATAEHWEVRYPGKPTEQDPKKHIGSAGQLCKVHLVNFMCHQNFEATFRCGDTCATAMLPMPRPPAVPPNARQPSL